MAIRYIQQGDDAPLPGKNTPIDDDSAIAWWGGVSRCAVGIAIAACLVVTSLSTALAQQVQQESGDQSDVPSGALVKSTALDYGELWENWVIPVAANLYQNLPLGEKDDLPAGNLFGQDDEDFWVNPVAPVPASLRWPQQYTFGDQSDVPAGKLLNFVSADEDYWENPAYPVPASLFQSLPYLPDREDFAAPTGTIADEDYWPNPAQPVAASLFQRLPYLPDPEEISAGNLFGQPDEDFWRNPVPPVAAANQWPQQWPFDVQEPAGALFGQFDEDYWQNRVPPIPATVYRSTLFSDPEEVPAGSLFGQADEDFWSQALFPAPVRASLYQPLPIAVDPDFVLPPSLGPDEDFWPQAQLPAPVAARLYQQLPLGDPELLPASTLKKFTSPDEDYWQNPVAPVPATVYRTPVFRDPEEVPAGKLVNVKPDEDYWQNRIAPVAATIYQPLPYLFDAAVPGVFAVQLPPEVLGGGIAWPYPELSHRHWSAPPSSQLKTEEPKKPKKQAGTAKPAGVSAEGELGVVSVSVSAAPFAHGGEGFAGRAVVRVAARPQHRCASAIFVLAGEVEIGTVRVRGVRNPTDEQLIRLLMEFP